MAPNLNRNALLLAPQALPLLLQPAFKDYQAPKVVDDAASYWCWEANVPTVDVLSADRIVENLVRASSPAVHREAAESTNPEHDSYWADEVEPAHTTTALQQTMPENYWDEACHERTASDLYWVATNNKTPPTRQCARHTANYWDEPQHGTTLSDAYWAESTQEPVASARYWTEARHEVTAADSYWVW